MMKVTRLFRAIFRHHELGWSFIPDPQLSFGIPLLSPSRLSNHSTTSTRICPVVYVPKSTEGIWSVCALRKSSSRFDTTSIPYRKLWYGSVQCRYRPPDNRLKFATPTQNTPGNGNTLLNTPLESSTPFVAEQTPDARPDVGKDACYAVHVRSRSTVDRRVLAVRGMKRMAPGGKCLQ